MSESPSVAGEFKKLLQQSSHYLTALVLNLSLGFVSFPIFTRIFTVADYGAIDLVQKLLLLLTAAGKLGQQNSALRFFDHDGFEKEPDRATRYYSTLYLGVTAMSIVVALAMSAALPLVPTSLVPPALRPLVQFSFLLILLRALQSILWSFLRIQERTKLYNAANVVLKAAQIGAVLLLLPVLGPSVRTYYAGTMGVEFLIVAALTIPLVTSGKMRLGSFDLTLFRTALLFGAPLVFQELAGITLESGDRLQVQMYLGPNPLGHYSVASGLAGYVNTLMTTPLTLAILPIYMRLWNSEGAEKTVRFLSLGLDFFLMAAAGVFAMVVVGAHDAVVLLASDKYRGADALIPMMVAGMLLYTTQTFTAAGLMIQKRTGLLALGLGLSAALKLGLNMVLLPRMGLQGAAVSTLVGYLFCCFYLALVSFRVLPLKIEYRSTLNYVLASAAGCVAGQAVNLAHPATDFLARVSLALAVYCAVLFSLDRKTRDLAGRAWRYLRPRAEVENPLAA